MLIYYDTDTQYAFFWEKKHLVKPQNDTLTTVKWLKTMKNESEIYPFLVELSLVQCLED